MDEAKLAEQGAKPLAEEFDRIAKIESREGLIELAAHLRTLGIAAPFSFHVAQDEKHSDQYAVHLRQGGLGLPERGYYLGISEDQKRIREQYREHVAKMLALLGNSREA